MYGNVLGGATAVTGAAIVLPNTGNNTVAVIATITLVVGVAILASSLVRFIAKKAYKN